LNKESVTHSGRKPITLLIQSQIKLSLKKKKKKKHNKIQQQKTITVSQTPASRNAVIGGDAWTTSVTTEDLLLHQTTAGDTQITKHHQPQPGSQIVILTL
jgi:hypothetical protein